MWNQVPVVATTAQIVPPGSARLWVRGTTALRPGDAVLLVLTGIRQTWEGGRSPFEPGGFLFGHWVTEPVTSRDLLTVTSAVPGPGATSGWTLVTFDRAVFPPLEPAQLITLNFPRTVASAYTFAERVRIFGWNAPDPNLLVVDGKPPHGAGGDDVDPVEAAAAAAEYTWDNFGLTLPLDLDGEHRAVLPGSRVVLEQSDAQIPCTVTTVQREGRSDFTVSGSVTAVGLLLDDGSADPQPPSLAGLERQRLVVHAVSTALDVEQMPDESPLSGTTVVVAATDPPVPAGRRVVLAGTDPAGGPLAVAADVVASTPIPGTGLSSEPGTTTLTLAAALPALSRLGLVVLANVAPATHGETVTQVLGSGDGRTAFASYPLRRAPLTHVRATTPDGARAALVVRVDGVEWTQVDVPARRRPAGPGLPGAAR